MTLLFEGHKLGPSKDPELSAVPAGIDGAQGGVTVLLAV